MTEGSGLLTEAVDAASSDPAGKARIAESVLAYREIDHASDRVCAIVAAALLEGRIQYALQWRLPDPSHQKKIFAVDGMLGTYAAKIDMGYSLRVYGQEARDNLLAIGSIRNRFAHRTYIRDFSHRELDSFFKKLTIYRRLDGMSETLLKLFPDPIAKNARHRERFVAAARTLDAYFVLDPFNQTQIVGHDPKF